MLPYVVVLRGAPYLFLHYSGAFEEITDILRGSNRSNENRSAPADEDRDQRLIIFKEFFEKAPDRPPDEE
jgi:hypothetical protein